MSSFKLGRFGFDGFFFFFFFVVCVFGWSVIRSFHTRKISIIYLFDVDAVAAIAAAAAAVSTVGVSI